MVQCYWRMFRRKLRTPGGDGGSERFGADSVPVGCTQLRRLLRRSSCDRSGAAPPKNDADRQGAQRTDLGHLAESASSCCALQTTHCERHIAGAPATAPMAIGDEVLAYAPAVRLGERRTVCSSNDWDNSPQSSMRERTGWLTAAPPHQEPDMGECRPKAARTKSRKKRRRGEKAHNLGKRHLLLR